MVKFNLCKIEKLSELFSIEMYNQAVINFLAATEVGMFPHR